MKTMKRKISLILAAVVLLSIVPITSVEANDRRLPIIFDTERRINTRTNLAGPNDGFFDARTPGEQRVISWGHWHNGQEFWLIEYRLFAGGTKRAFALRNDVVGASFAPIDIILPRDTNVFRHSNLSSRFGQVWGGERARNMGALYSVAMADSGCGNALLVLFMLANGGGRMGWVPYSALEGAINRNTGQVFRGRAWVSPGDTPPTGGGNSAIRFPLRGNMQHSSSVRTNGILCDFRAPLNTRVYAPADGRVQFRQTVGRVNGQDTLVSFGNSIVFTSSCGRYHMVMAHLNSFSGANLQIPSNRTARISASNISARTINLGSRQVRQGEHIGNTGSTGNSSAPHLHLELRVNNRPADPTSVLRTW